jgi:hypothetical protein
MSMTDQLSNTLVICGTAVFALLLWALSIAFVLRDVNRRNLPGYEQVIWLVLAALLPLVGGLAYLFARGLDRFLSPRPAKNPEPVKRVTADQVPQDLGKRMPTIAAGDLYRQTIAELGPVVSAGGARGRRADMFLLFLAGPLAGRKFTIEDLPVRIGRGPLASLSLDDDQGVSRQHAEIYESAGLLRIRDLKSTHGTYLNGKSITDENLNPGDHLSVGLSTLVFMVEGEDGVS